MSHKKVTTGCVNSPCLSSLSAQHSSFPKHVIANVKVNDIVARALIDTGSTNSYLSKSFVDQNHITYTSLRFVANMDNTSLKTEIHGICNVKLQFLQHAYEQVEFFIMPALVSDVISGDDLLERRNSVTFRFDGKLPNLVISLLMPTAQVEYPQLFSHMLSTCKLIVVKTRKFSAADQKLIRIKTKRLLQEGRIEKSNLPWRAQPLIVDDGNDKKRMCIDFSQTVNLYTMLDAYPLPTIESIVNKVAKWKYISTFDLKSAYHQIQINPKDRHFTFQSGYKLYQWKYLPFGLTNAVPAFQRAINEFIAKYDLKCVNAYLDNITVGGMTQQEHYDNLAALRRAAEVDQFTFNKEKSQYNCTETSLLGYRVGGGVIKPDPQRVQALQDLPIPTTKKELQRIMELFTYYAK